MKKSNAGEWGNVKLRVRELMYQKGMKPSVAKLMAMGVGRNMATEMLNGEPKSIKFDDLLSLCVHLYCTPRELLGLQMDVNDLPPQHPLREWLEDKIEIPFNNLFRLNQQQISEVVETIEEIKRRDWGEEDWSQPKQPTK